MGKHVSEVARLRQNIEAEIEAMHRGFSAIAAGTARHDFIKARMERLGDQQDQLAEYVGSSTAARIVCELYINTEQNKFLKPETPTG